jgi:hypothetical protein
MGCLPSSVFEKKITMGHFDWTIILGQRIAVSIWGWSASPLAHLSRSEGENFGQRIWDKMRCYWEHLWGTYWEQKKQIREHIGKKEKTPKKLLSPPPQKKKLRTPQPSHWLYEIYVFKSVCHHFQLGPLTPLEIQGTYLVQSLHFLYVYLNDIREFIYIVHVSV